MDFSISHIADLLLRSLYESLTDDEQLVLQQWVDASLHHQALYNELHNEEELSQKMLTFSPKEEKELNASILQRIQAQLFMEEEKGFVPAPEAVDRIWAIRHWWVAASVFLLICTGSFLWLNHKQSMQIAAIAQQTVDIIPGKEGAILTLADGSEVLLDTITAGIVALQGGVTAKVHDGRLLYEGTSKDAVYNTMSTPKGRQYPLTLPDGTKVWLNAASSIRYPTFFSAKERRVTITGEVYFEVAPNATAPFYVNMRDGTTVTVLGTQFNVNAYENEASINATLLQGSIQVSASGRSQNFEEVVLQPGQQAQITPIASSAIKVMADVDIENAVAWKNGLFYFSGLTFEEIMRQLERWYDIKVVYENNIVPTKRLTGKMTRGVSLNGLLKILAKLGVGYKLEDRILTISP